MAIKDITIGQYVPGETPIHNMDPRVKILLSIVFIIVLFIVKNYTGYVYVVLYIMASVYISKVHLSYIFKGLKPLLAILFITMAINMFLTPGHTIWSYGSIRLTAEGLNLAIFMSIRLILLIVGTSLLTLTTSPIMLTDGIELILSPFKRIGVPAHELAMMMTIALRFIPTLLDEADKIMKAQMARGADFESGNIIKRAKAMVPLLVPLFINAFRRADELAMAMEARCYRGGENRTRMRQLRIEKRDYVAIIVTIVMILLVVMDRFVVSL
ncbi:energy-coupling factor transport system permease protein [Caldanaerobius fijiensis DSM 17918]|uniref:Energy-coupling factor transporter transmembrane protein EcfT n=1 Tax=Caldanaerobius fijiensis DSM 17918 TaxID=1121256 RepID=A0A1M4YRA2_9THEO|nr:energy-coupling factor transporter transmembrane component T [Caldanaerobius fijiensis]SHF08379.1 energy-coupling factor transport system permease protein [Caldanaerobius fijiensis DSM 17918]